MGPASKKHHKKHSKKHKKDKKRKNRSKSSSSEEEWVEKDVSAPTLQSNSNSRRDDWMSMDVLLSATSGSQKTPKEKDVDKPKDKSVLDQPGQSVRELNPYWKNGGTGLPPEKNNVTEDKTKYQIHSHKSHVEEKRGHNEKERSHVSGKGHAFRQSTGYYKNKDKASGKYSDSSDSEDNFHHKRHDSPLPPRHESTKPKTHYKSSRTHFKMPCDNEPDSRDSHSKRNFAESTLSRNASKCGWKKIKPDSTVKHERHEIKEGKELMSEQTFTNKEETKSPVTEDKIMTYNDLNELAAKMIKAEIMGNKELAEKLKIELDRARQNIPSGSQSKEVLLTQTDNKGFTRPYKSSSSGEQHRRKKTVQTHENNKRVRYFADDDNQSLQSMFEKEHYSSSDNQNATFFKLVQKELLGSKSGSLSLDDGFEETAALDDKTAVEKQRRSQAIKEYREKEKIYDNCRWCLTGPKFDEKIMVLPKSKIYLCVPPFQSLTTGHCLIVPNSHVTCGTQVDEDVWEEIMEIRRKLVAVFNALDEDVIFFENASYLHKFPHMVLHCVPIAKEMGDVAPIYFKKAILECESEWSNNKKVIDLSSKNVRKAVPKGLPYFAVDFGMQGGYAHVIEEQKLFPNNFAQGIIGGMLDLEHTVWRKIKFDTEEVVNTKKDYLKKLLLSTV